MKQLIAITLPTFFPREAQVITTLFQNGLERLHLRKPAASADELRRLLDEIPGEYHPAIALHDHFELWAEYPAIGGVHLNSRNAEVPPGFRGRISRSCHTFEEVVANRQLDYCFLSPIFESISKEGYGSGFPMERLREAAQAGIITPQVFALGGISLETLPRLSGLPFGGAAVLGTFNGFCNDVRCVHGKQTCKGERFVAVFCHAERICRNV